MLGRIASKHDIYIINICRLQVKMIKVQRQPLIGCLWIKVLNITIDNWTNQLIMGRVGYVPSLLCAELVMCRVCNVPSCPTILNYYGQCMFKGTHIVGGIVFQKHSSSFLS